MAAVSTLASAVLPLIRTRTDLYRYSAANAHGRDMHEAVDILEAAIPSADPVDIYSVTHKALASALKVIARADDSSGIIGDACDIDAIIRTHAKDRRVAAWLEDTAEAFEEARSASSSTGRSRRPTSTAGTSRSRRRTTGADSWRRIGQPRRSTRGSRCSASGPRRLRRPGCTRRLAGLGRAIATRLWRPWRRVRVTRSCSHCSP